MAQPRPPVALGELEAVIFDAGGTLVELDYAFIAGRAGARGVPLAAAGLRRAEARSRQAIDARARRTGRVKDRDADRLGRYFGELLEAAGVESGLAWALAAELHAVHVADSLWRVPLEGAYETLRGLRARGLKTAVVSNADGRVARILEGVGLAPHLDVIVDSHLEGVEKPDPEIFRRALERLGVPADRAAYVGDIYSIDALGARGAGLHPVLIDPTGGYGTLDVPVIALLRELLDA